MRDKVILLQEEPRGPSQLIEIPVTRGGQTRITIPDIQQLRSTVDQIIILKAMRLITSDVLVGGVISGLVTAPDTELQKMTLILYCEGWEKAQYIPVLTMNDVALPGGGNPHRYHTMRFNNWQNVDWSKSYIQYANGTGSDIVGGAYVIMFDVEYIKLDGSGNELGPT